MLHSLGVTGHCMEPMECVLCYSLVTHGVEGSSMSFLEGMREISGLTKIYQTFVIDAFEFETSHFPYDLCCFLLK